jgi:hypothetical protein
MKFYFLLFFGPAVISLMASILALSFLTITAWSSIFIVATVIYPFIFIPLATMSFIFKHYYRRSNENFWTMKKYLDLAHSDLIIERKKNTSVNVEKLLELKKYREEINKFDDYWKNNLQHAIPEVQFK